MRGDCEADKRVEVIFITQTDEGEDSLKKLLKNSLIQLITSQETQIIILTQPLIKFLSRNLWRIFIHVQGVSLIIYHF